MKRLRNYIIWAVVLYLFISGIMIGIPYIRYVMFADQVDNIARGLNYDGTVVRATNRLIEAAAENKIPVTKEDMVVKKDPRTRYTVVEVKYSVEVTTPFGLYTHVWDFHPKAEFGKK